MILTFSLGFAIAVLVWALYEWHRPAVIVRVLHSTPYFRTPIVVNGEAFADSSPSARAAAARAIVEKVLH